MSGVYSKINAKLIITFAVVFLLACRKDPEIRVVTYTPKKAKFKDSIHVGLNIHSIQPINSPFDNSFYIFQNIGSNPNYLVTKCDSFMNLIYTKGINLGTFKFSGAAASKNSSDFYVLSASNNYKGTPFNVPGLYFQTSICTDINNKANYHSYFINDSIYTEEYNSTRLTKFNSEGQQVWSRTVEGSFNLNKSIETDNDGNIYILALRRNRNWFHKNNNLQGLWPYYYFGNDSSSFTIHKFDNNGNEIFKKTCENVSGYVRHFYPRLAVSKHAIYVTTIQNFFVFSKDGALLWETKPISNDCSHAVYDVLSSPVMERAIIYSRLPGTRFERLNLIKMTGARVTSSTEIENFSLLNYSYLVMDSEETIYVGRDNGVQKLTDNGNVIWYGPANSLRSPIGGLGVLDRYGSLYWFSFSNGWLYGFKYNQNGEYQ